MRSTNTFFILAMKNLRPNEIDATSNQTVEFSNANFHFVFGVYNFAAQYVTLKCDCFLKQYETGIGLVFCFCKGNDGLNSN